MIERLTVSPEMAAEWLKRNENNRRPKLGAIDRYARDMAAGKWQFTGEAIKFGVTGRLLDGQNRLKACVKAQVPFTTLVVTDLPEESQHVMDSGQVRLTSDMLSLRGYKNTVSLGAAITTHYWWRSGLLKDAGSNPAGRNRPTKDEALAHLERFPGLPEVVDRTVNIRSDIAIGPLSTAVYETRLLDKEESEFFFDRIKNYETWGPEDPVTVLLKRVAKINSYRNSTRIRSAYLYMLFRTWNAVRKGEVIRAFHLGSPESGFPAIPTPI